MLRKGDMCRLRTNDQVVLKFSSGEIELRNRDSNFANTSMCARIF